VLRVAILANGMALRMGLRQMLSSLPEVEVPAEGTHALNLPPVDVWLLASAGLLPRDNGDHPAILLLSNDPVEASQLRAYPLWGLLPLETGEAELAAALQALGEGLCVGAPALLGSLLAPRPRPEADLADSTVQPLTERELEVLQLAAEGQANKQIALSLGLSEHTVKFHLSSIYTKLSVTSRTEAVRSGVRRGLGAL
jgi:DNA-binding NarL/FixJ family response regulator